MVRRNSNRSRKSIRPSKNSTCPKTETLVSNRKPKKSGFRAIEEIKRLQKTTKLLIPKLPFSRLVKEIIVDIFPRSEIHRIRSDALEALQEASEMYIVQMFEDSILLTYHCKRVTLTVKDMRLVRRLRGRGDVINH